MERRGNHVCGLMRLYGVRGDGGGVSDVPERSCCSADPLGRWHFGRNLAGTPVGGGTGCVNGKLAVAALYLALQMPMIFYSAAVAKGLSGIKAAPEVCSLT